MDIQLISKAEKEAEKAEKLDAFSGIKLLHIKKKIYSLVGQIGKHGIFEEYTKHDISHIDAMLDSLDWIIPKDTQENMTPADWLLIVLATYFHDLGMLVTKDEFSNRDKTSFVKYKQEIFDGKFGIEYKEEILSLDGEDQDRFIYQEYVRKLHGERIKFWILGDINSNFSVHLSVVNEIKKLINIDNKLFLRDLALICESHQLSDLDNFEKYKISQPYGRTPNEEANVFYAALILRTADLLHITSDRTPTVELNIINPTNPISILEWTKQNAVTNIRAQKKIDKEGNIDDSLPKDTFEITALFDKEEGYFALISYLSYAKKELLNSFNLNVKAKKAKSSHFDFPWKNIDDSKIEAVGFEKKQFEFTLDQNRILDLLVGHTLYNDPTVVLRELAQNAIDASRLKKYELEQIDTSLQYDPTVIIEWEKKTGNLFFIDNGTGMDLDIIQNHLLKVGSSRYQSEDFKKKYPNFSSISRFGIGLLTGFLIADDIDILTKTEEMDAPILLKIRKVHGKYLLKHGSDDAKHQLIGESGTSIKLYVRRTVNLDDIEENLNRWILFPSCKVSLTDNGNIKTIGYNSPKDILVNYLETNGLIVDDKNYKVVEYEAEGINLAIALQYAKFLGEWKFIEKERGERESNIPIGTCIEGIRIDFQTPGFDETSILAVANSTGRLAPKTNVARSNIEVTPEREKLLFVIYKHYLESIRCQFEELNNKFSISWAATEIGWLLNSLASPNRSTRYPREKAELLNEDFFKNALKTFPGVLIERDENRSIITINDLEKIKHYWTINCASYSSANKLIREIKSSRSALSIMKSIYEKDSQIEHLDILLCSSDYQNYLTHTLLEIFQISEIKAISEQRRLDLKWTLIEKKKWIEISIDDSSDHLYSGRVNKIFIQNGDINTSGLSTETAINTPYGILLLDNSPLNGYLIALSDIFTNKTREEKYILERILQYLMGFFYRESHLDTRELSESLDRMFNKESSRFNEVCWQLIKKEELIEVILKTNFEMYDLDKWYRNRSRWLFY